MSVGALCKSVDPSQLTTDFDGSLPYDHNTWIELRLLIEEFSDYTDIMLDKVSMCGVGRCLLDELMIMVRLRR